MPRPKANPSTGFPLASGWPIFSSCKLWNFGSYTSPRCLSPVTPPTSIDLGVKGTHLTAGDPKPERLSLPQKQVFVYEAAKGLEGGREALESWTRKDLLQVLCLEMGKERKYTGLSKSKIVDQLLKLVSLKEIGKENLSSAALLQPYTFSSQSPTRRQRKGGHPFWLPTSNQISVSAEEKPELSWICRNSACKAQLSPGVFFCKRCSCCICQQFDDNKDPSLWIVCTPEPLGGESACRLSCHIECALDHGMAGVVSEGRTARLDGSYRCESCGRISGLIGCWKKQLLIAKDARRVDVLCHRLSLSHRLLNGTHLYKEIHDLVDKAIKKLEAEVGSIREGSAKLVRGIVNRLSSGAEVQKLIGIALEKAQTLTTGSSPALEDTNLEEESVETPCTIHFEDISSSSVVVTVKGGSYLAGQEIIGYKIWHCKARELSYLNSPTCTITKFARRALISNLQACTEYAFRVVPFSEKGDAGLSEARCFTKSVEVIRRPIELPHPTEPSFRIVSNTPQELSNGVQIDNESLYNSDEFATNFKVRDLGKVLHAALGNEQQSIDVFEGIFRSTGRSRVLDNQHNADENKDERASPALNVLLSPGPDASSIGEDGGRCKQGHVAIHRASHINGDLKLGTDDGRVTVDTGCVNANSVKVCSKDSSGLIHERQAVHSLKDGCVNHPKLTEFDEASDPGNSQTARGEETDAISPDASGSLQANGGNELNDTPVETLRTDDLESNGHGESWAVQVRGGGPAIGMEPQIGIVTKRTVGLERAHHCYNLLNGCTGNATGTSICAAKSYEFCVKMVRWLECEGHLKEDFRMKFLTWFSLRATDHEKRVVSVFIDTLQDNPASLAGQLEDTFADIISAKRQQVLPNGFCNRLWH